MKIIDIINGPWAITPEMYSEIRSIYAKHLRGEKLNIKDVEAATGKTLKNKPQGYDLVNGTAVIPVHGVIAKRMNLFMDISGGASTQMVERDLRDALADPAVEKIVLYIDSPGGTVDGTFDLANFIYESRGSKPIIAYTDGMMTSAAYAIGAAADKVFISGDTVAIGNIGVVAAHEDISKMQEKMGVKTTEIFAGKYKRIAGQYEPLTVEGKQTIQDRVDYFYSIFVNTVARFRGVSAETVLNTMSTSVKDMHIGLQAVEAGLVDGVSTLDRLINHKADGVSVKEGFRTSRNDKSESQEEVMTLAELRENHTDVFQAAYQEGFDACAATQGEAVATAHKEGIAAEQTRIKAVREQAIPGHEALIETLMFDGATTGEQAAVKVLAAEKTLRTKKAADFKADGDDVGSVPTTDATGTDTQGTMKRTEFSKLDPSKQLAFVKAGGKITD